MTNKFKNFVRKNFYLAFIIIKSVKALILNIINFVTYLSENFLKKKKLIKLYKKKINTKTLIKKIPYKHLLAIYIIQSLNKIFEYKIKFILMDGLCLGLIRQQTFAGRPKDVDLAVNKDDFIKIVEKFYKVENYFNLSKKYKVNNIPISITKNNKKNFKKNFTNTAKDIFKKLDVPSSFFIMYDNLYFYFNEMLVEIKCIEKEKNTKYCKNFKFFRYKPRYIDFIKPKKIRGYSKIFFYIPGNAKMYLRSKYGNNYLNSNKKQFNLKKKSVYNLTNNK